MVWPSGKTFRSRVYCRQILSHASSPQGGKAGNRGLGGLWAGLVIRLRQILASSHRVMLIEGPWRTNATHLDIGDTFKIGQVSETQTPPS